VTNLLEQPDRSSPIIEQSGPQRTVAGRTLFAVLLNSYLAVGIVLVFGFGSAMEDARSHVAASSG
jgi:hypothetical protein